MATPTQIRQAVVAALVAANTSAGARVYDSRQDPWDTTESYPSLSVDSLDSEGTPASIDFPAYRREDRVAVEAAVSPAPVSGQTPAQADTALAAAVDTVEGEILSALLRDAGFLGYNAGRPPAFTIRRGMTSAAERRIGTLQITFRLTQQTVDYDPDDVSAENSFEIAHIESDLAPGDDAVDAEQTLTLDGDP